MLLHRLVSKTSDISAEEEQAADAPVTQLEADLQKSRYDACRYN